MIKIKSEISDDRKITMRQMKPLQIARLNSSKEIVMRTSNSDIFEVMSLTETGEDCCWDEVGANGIQVELLPIGEKITLEISNDE